MIKNLFPALAVFFLVIFLGVKDSQASYRWKGIEWTPRVGLEETFDDNITYASDNELFDFITKISGELEAKYEGKTTQATLKGKLEEDLYGRHSRFNNFAQTLNFNLQKDFKRLGLLNFSEDFIHAEEPRDFEDSFGRENGKYSYYRNRIRLDYLKNITKQWGIRFRYLNEIFERDQGLSDSVANQLGAQIDYAASSATVFFMGYDFKHRQFNSEKNSGVNGLTWGVRRYLTERLYVEGTAGVDVIRNFMGDIETRPRFGVSLIGDVDEKTTAVLAFEHKFDSTGFQQDIFQSWKISTSLKRQLSERLQANLTGFFGRGRFDALAITDNLSGINTGLTYDFTDNFKGIFQYTFAKTDSSNSNRDYTKNVVTLGGLVAF